MNLLKKHIFLFCLFIVGIFQIKAQITVTNTNNANQLAQKLVGPGVIITNASTLCNQNQAGIFKVTTANLGIDSGIVLTTGLAATNVPNYGVNGTQINTATANQGTGGDADLTALAGVSTFDRCILEFDFTAKGDSIFFQYVFGSEEYPQYNCSNYNDVFGFFITGPGYPTPKNIALVPGTNIPVAINSVNSGMLYPGGVWANCTNMGPGSPFTGYYTDNTGGTSVTYEGFTHLFTAKAAIQPCSTYHLKLAIADGFDHILDSGVFLKAGSLKSDNVKLSVKTDSLIAGVASVFEGCDTAKLKIHRQIVQANPGIDTVKLIISGSAQNGIDYNLIQTNYIFSNNPTDTIKNINIIPINDLLIEGTETVIIKLKDKCNNIIDSVTILIKDPPTFKILNNDTTICQGASVSINAIFDPGLTYTWVPQAGVANPTQLNTILTPTVTTTYVVKGSYGNCSAVYDTIKVTVEPSPTINLAPTNILCNGQNLGSILATGTVGNNPLTFTLQPGGINANGSPHTYNNLAAGTYTVTITSGLGCTKTATTTITQPPAIGWSNVTAVHIACNAGNVGQVITIANGGVPPFTYNLQPGNITNGTGTFTGLAAGSYTVTAKDNNNCTKVAVVLVTQAQSLSWANVSHTDITCNGMNNGSIQVTAAGGVGNINYNLQPGNINNNTGNFNNLGANIYTIVAVDANGCSASTTINITQFPPVSISNVTKTNVLCAGGNTGSINITAIGGAPTLSYTLNPGAITNNTGLFNNITSGNYTITVVDANGCSVSTAVTITQPAPLAFAPPTITNPTCNPGNNGSINITASGGTPSYTYKIGAGAFQPGGVFTGLTTGTYIITVKDANGCTKTTSVTLSNNNAPILTNNSTPPPCYNGVGNINVTATNGVAPYTFTLQPLGLVNNNGQFPGVAPGIYTVNVVDANGCTASIVVNIVVPPQLTWSNFTKNNIPCNGIGTGSIHATASGGTGTITYHLNPGNVNNNNGAFTNLAMNTYTVIATDANGCTISSVATIGISPSITFNNPIVTNIYCNGGNNGSINVTASGGTGVITYTITPGGFNNITGQFINFNAGIYTIQAVDVVGCTASTVITITQPPPLVISNISSTSPSCVPGLDGSITISATGGTPTYSYKINGMPYQGSNTFNNLNIGSYTITVKDANNCTVTSVFNLINPNAPSFANVVVSQANCAGANTGSITATINGGVAPITFTINPLGLVNNNGIFNNLPVNVYTITATDANNCIVTTTATIVQPSALIWAQANYNNITCNGMTDGAIHVTATGGNGAINYTLMPGNINNANGNFLPLVANNYTVTATDANGCSLTTIFVITNPAALNWNLPTQNNITCFNANNGSINAPAIGGTGTISYTLMPGNINNQTGLFNNLGPATYTITAIDANGCSITSSFSLVSPTALSIVNLVGTTPSCVPGNNATITVTAAGGVTPYLYSINGNAPQAANVFTNIGVSNYTISVIDANGCTATSVITISNPASPSITNVNITNILCYGDNTGSISVTATGGVGALNYQLLPVNINNQTGQFNNLYANNYTVSVTDANGCSATSNIILTQPPQLVWDSVNNRDIPCYGANNGLVTSSASGGTGQIVYTLLPPNVTNLNGAFFGLGVGVYTLLATDDNGCEISAVFNINQAAQILINTTTTAITCYGGNNGIINAVASGGVGGFEFTLMPGNVINQTGTFTNLISGTYTISVKDANGCLATTTVFLNQAPQVQLTNVTTTPASCTPGCDASATIMASGGNGVFTYSLNAGPFQVSNIFSNLCTGVYTIVIKDGNNCTGSGTFSIATANGPNQIATNITNISCAGGNNGSIQVTINGGIGPINYTLNPGAINNNNGQFNNLPQGVYTVTAIDANGCSLSSIVTLTQPPALIITNIATTDVTCFNGNDGGTTVYANGGNGILTYNIQPLNITNNTGQFNNLNANIYTITITDANGCTVTSTFVINMPSQVTFTNIVNIPVSCFGNNTGSIHATATGGIGNINYTLLPNNLNNLSGTFIGLGAATYTIVASDMNNCTATIVVIITQPSQLIINQIVTTPPTCVPGGDGTISVTASGATPNYTYSVNGGVFQLNNLFNNLIAGTYTVNVKDANGCTQTSTVQVIPPSMPVINNITATNATCNPGCDASLTISSANGNGIHNYSIDGINFQNFNTISNLCVGNYTVIVKDASGCTVTSTAIINTYPSPTITNVIVNNALCNNANNGSIQLVVTGGNAPIQYLLMPNNINNANGVFTGLAAGAYTITGTDIYGCTLSTIVSVTQPNSLSFDNVTATPSLCFNVANGSISCPVVGGTAPYNFTITPTGVFAAPNNFNGLLGNITYTITATDANGCSVSTSIFVPQPTQVIINSIVNTPVTCHGMNNGTLTATATGGVGIITYTLMPNNINNNTGQFQNLNGNTYTIIATDANGCTATSTSILFEPTAISITNVVATDIICYGQINGTITINATGGINPLTYQLMPGNIVNANGIFNGLGQNIYTITITDANGCTLTNTQIINEPTQVHFNGTTITHVLCNAQHNGTIQTNASGGVGLINYTCNPGAINSPNGLFNNLGAGVYTLTATDANGCTATTTAVVLQPPMLGIVLDSINHITCHGGNDGFIITSTIGGTSPYNFYLQPLGLTNQIGAFYSLVANNNYKVIVEDN
ncbi:MAG: SprB repeat-containing protein, partial [Bacteroidia bacterium]|nr:SprB repeat-containing protein [Bacteroidia bacterium]